MSDLGLFGLYVLAWAATLVGSCAVVTAGVLVGDWLRRRRRK